MILVKTFFVLLLVNILVVYLANTWFPQYVVLGTQSISLWWALIHSMSVLALINTFAIPFIRAIENKKGRMLTSKEWMVKYFIINFVGVWVVARFSDQFGFGISSWMVAVVLAVVLDLVQGMSMMQLEKTKS